MNWELMNESWPELLAAVPTTLMLAASSLFLGFFLALGISLMRVSKIWIFSNFAYFFVYIFRSTPLLVQIFLIYYGSGQFKDFFESIGLWVFFREAWFCAIFSLTLNTAAYSSEIIRVPFGQIEAAKAVGMSKALLFRRITFPVAIRQALPGYGNEIILMVKATSLASTITLLEITGVAKKIISATWSPIEIFIIAGIFYLAINFIVTRIIQTMEIRLSPQLFRDRKSWWQSLRQNGRQPAKTKTFR